MKALSYVCKVLTILAALATAAFFFMEFFTIKGYYSMSGIQAIFGSTQTVGSASYVTYKSTWYLVAFLLCIVTALFAGLSFKFKGLKFASVISGGLLMINALVIFCTSTLSFFDVRTSPLTKISADLITRQPAVLFFMIGAIVAFVVAVVTMFVADYAEVLESNGAKLTIPKRVKAFFKDYKSEITKIVWPSRNTVFKNVIVVLVMCLVVGAFIWALDFGLIRLVGLILGIDL